MEAKPVFRDAQFLAEFSNLDPNNASEIDYFRRNHPDFAPDAWWDYQPTVGDSVPFEAISNALAKLPSRKHSDLDLDRRNDAIGLMVALHQLEEGQNLPLQWLLTQKRLREAWNLWRKGKELNWTDLLKLLASVFDPENSPYVRMKLEGPHPQPSYADMTTLDSEKHWGYHRGVEYLSGGDSSWRAKVCDECGKRFVADHNKRKYCSVAGEDGLKCAAKVIARSHIEWSRENNWGHKRIHQMRAKKKS